MDLLVSKVIKKVLSKFIRSCPDLGSGNDIKVGTNSSLKLREVKLKEPVIAGMLHLPKKIRLMNAECNEMNVNVPLSIMSKPIDIVIKGIKVSALERSNVPDVHVEQKEENKQKKGKNKKSKREIYIFIFYNINLKLGTKFPT